MYLTYLLVVTSRFYLTCYCYTECTYVQLTESEVGSWVGSKYLPYLLEPKKEKKGLNASI